MVDSVLTRHWKFPHYGAEYTEQQTLNAYLTRTDLLLFGCAQTGCSYKYVVEFISAIKSKLEQQYVVNDGKILMHIRAIFHKKPIKFKAIYGDNRTDISKILNPYDANQSGGADIRD